MLIRDNFQPTDFADAEVRVSDWHEADYYTHGAVRVWVCRCTNYWFHRHEWKPKQGNQTTMDDWVFYGYYPRKAWAPHMKPAPNMEDI